MQKQPLILTLKLDEESQAFFDKQRKLYFPAERNFLKAHLTLFHQLPDEPETLDYFSNIIHDSFEIKAAGLLFLGAGVAYRMDSPVLIGLRQQIKSRFKARLISQDLQPFRPHITIQNKVSPELAKGLLRELSEGFEPFVLRANGLCLWRYLGGPWSLQASYLFS